MVKSQHPFGTFKSFQSDLLADSIIYSTNSSSIWSIHHQSSCGLWCRHYYMVHIFSWRSIIVWTKRRRDSRTRASCLADLVQWLHMQFAKRLKQFLKKQGEYYLPLWKEETSLLKLHPQLTYKQNEKQYYKLTL